MKSRQGGWGRKSRAGPAGPEPPHSCNIRIVDSRNTVLSMGTGRTENAHISMLPSLNRKTTFHAVSSADTQSLGRRHIRKVDGLSLREAVFISRSDLVATFCFFDEKERCELRSHPSFNVWEVECRLKNVRLLTINQTHRNLNISWRLRG
jgi:hypothetical protein